jgi:phage baseplate assembly protein W
MQTTPLTKLIETALEQVINQAVAERTENAHPKVSIDEEILETELDGLQMEIERQLDENRSKHFIDFNSAEFSLDHESRVQLDDITINTGDIAERCVEVIASRFQKIIERCVIVSVEEEKVVQSPVDQEGA